MDERSYATDNGFYIGDSVSYTAGKTEKLSTIEEIVSKGHKQWLGDGKDIPYYQAPCSIVRLADGTETTDLRLTRRA